VKGYQQILFDWDGCLVKTLGIHLDAYRKVFAECGIQTSDWDITHKVFGSWEGPKNLGVDDLQVFTQRYLYELNLSYPHAPLYEGADEILKTLKSKGKRLALLTTSRMTMVKPLFERTGLDKYFEVILTAEDVEKHKPDPEVINRALELLGDGREEVVMVGDSKSDLEAANRAGIDVVLFYPDEHRKFYDFKMLEDYKPTWVIKSLWELGKLCG
jgi:pyrophosphatase PpaX